MPPQRGLLDGFSTGLIALESYLKRTCEEVVCEIADLGRSNLQEIEDAFLNFRKAHSDRHWLVGITTTTASYQAALKCAELAKRLLPGGRVVFGGHHASADPETILRHHGDLVDIVAIGEGERILERIVQEYPDPSQVPGVAYLDRHGQYTRNAPPVPLREDELDKIEVFYRGGLAGTPGKFKTTTYVSARGCPHRCAFCAVANQPIRAKSVRQITDDISSLVGSGYRRISVEDNFFAHAPKRTKEICDAFQDLRETKGIAFDWDCQTRVESLARKNTIQELANGGCVAAYVGVESLVPEQLLYLNKTRSPEAYLAMLGNSVIPDLLESSIDCYLNLQFGFPGETEDDFECSNELLGMWGSWAAEMERTITVFPQLHVIYPGTGHFRQGVAEGRFSVEVFEGFTAWEHEHQPILTWLGEHFAHGVGGLPEGILDPSLLRANQFEVLPTETSRITRWLHKLSALDGIEIFRYGAHLV